MQTLTEKTAKFLQDTGWEDIIFNDGYSSFNNTWAKCVVRKIGKQVQIRGCVKGFSSISYTSFATIPEKFRPSSTQQFVENKINSAINYATMNITTAGVLSFTNASFEVNEEDGININCTYLVD